MDLTEKFVDREEVFSGKILHVFRDTVELPDGRESVREWISHPGAVAVVPLFEDGSTILIRQYRYPARRVFLEVPAGKLDEPGEAPEDVARRELMEEIGFATNRLTPMGETYSCIGYSDEVIYLFLAEELEEGTSGGDDEEFLEPVRMMFDEAVTMAHAGEITDAKTTVALIRAAAVVDERRQAGAAW
jgi:ADP-ribose pyrophosphatase